jgi:adenylate cyclase class 2
MSVEIEAKLYLPNLEAIRARLIQLQAETVAERILEHNQLFASPYQDFRQQRIVLRLRQDTVAKITYKAPSIIEVDGANSRLELETTIGDMETLDAILQALGYTHSLYYEKYRTVYRLPVVPDTLIMLDELPFGDFLEAEGSPEGIERALQNLGIAKAHRIRANYAGIFEVICQAHQLDITDISFEAFVGVKIDPTIFDTL